MSRRAHLTSHASAIALTAASLFALSAVVVSKPSLAQTAPNGGSTSITRDSEAERKLNLPAASFQTREERLNAKPLDWNTTIGKPKPLKLTAKERKALKNAKPETSSGGAPHPDAEAIARKLHPDDWK